MRQITPRSDADHLSKFELEKSLKASDLKPLDMLLAVLRNDSLPLPVRLDAAKNAAPYCHKKMPMAIEGGDKPVIGLPMDALRSLSAKELKALEELLSKAGVAP